MGAGTGWVRSAAACAAAVLLAAGGPAAGAAAEAAPGAADGLTAEAVDAYVRDHLDSSAATGVAVAVTRGTEVVRAAGYGETSAGEPMAADTPMGVASVSKAFTALAVMQLAEDGEVDLDRPVREQLPEFGTADPRSDRITVRQLLDQSSGMSDQGFREKSEPQPGDLEEAVARLEKAVLVADPGTEWHYTNPNYHVAARLVEEVSGRPFGEYLRERVFEPLGMDGSTTVGGSGDLAGAGVARGHIAVLGAPIAVPEPDGFFDGAAGVVTTADDMAAWLIAQNAGGALPGGERILSAEGIAETHRASAPDGRTGLGWTTGTTPAGTEYVGHGGIEFTFTAEQRLLPESGVGIAVMADTGLGRGDASALVAGLTALAEGGEPGGSADTLLFWVDVLFIGAAAAAAALGVRGVLRAPLWVDRRWADRRGRRWAAAARCLPLVAAAAVGPSVHRLLSLAAQGRDATWLQAGYTAPTAVLFASVLTAACTAVLAARAAAALRGRTPGARRERGERG
ncbi:serine hydrolase domain-containing protein [Nocardiopsis potens]|uniref:serine hydrolase domain-containing protein n=1 Tax=Nocardiopsis potens TaxID=1246458 RepID=UPI00034805EB|nr:serine hydrolase domain-containing protein [Nocardiopsis potens]